MKNGRSCFKKTLIPDTLVLSESKFNLPILKIPYIYRTGPTSYMLFRDFALTIEGAKIEKVVLDDSTGTQLALGSAYVVNDGSGKK